MKKEIKLKGRVARSASLKPYTTIYLIRHCQPNYLLQKKLGDSRMPLSRTGIGEAERLAHHLNNLGIQTVYSSAMERARQSAEIFLCHKKCRYEIEEGLNEFDWSRWYRVQYFNISLEERGKHIVDKAELKRLLTRKKQEGKAVLGRIVKENKGKNIAIFTHGNFIRSILTGILDADIFGFYFFLHSLAGAR